MTVDLRWREVDFPALSSVHSSGQTCFLEHQDRPEWARKVLNMGGAWVFYLGGQLATSTASLSTALAVAWMDTERVHLTDLGLLKYDRYFFVRMNDGRTFQRGPFKDLDYGHHLRKRPRCLEQYSSQR